MTIHEFKNPDGAIREYKLILADNFEPVPLPGRDEWLAELRSGKFEQGVGFLCANERYCCLGVLCEVNKSKFVFRQVEGLTVKRYGPDGDDQYKCLPGGMPQYRTLQGLGQFPYGAHIEYPEVSDGARATGNTLTTLNDILRLDFNQIADIVEKLWVHAPLPNAIPLP